MDGLEALGGMNELEGGLFTSARLQKSFIKKPIEILGGSENRVELLFNGFPHYRNKNLCFINADRCLLMYSTRMLCDRRYPNALKIVYTP